MNIPILAILCYLIGSIPFSYLIGRFMGGMDIRRHGSGNVGATNILRTLGWPYALLALTGDVLKGVVPAWLATLYGGDVLVAVCCLAAVAGHCYSVFLGFKGGKGVATSAGVLLYLSPKTVLILFIIFLAVVLVFRYVSLGSLIGAAACPFVFILLYPQRPWLVVLGLVLAMLVIFQHKDNMNRLRKGQEPRIFG